MPLRNLRAGIGALVTILALTTPVSATLNPGDIAIIGRIKVTSPAVDSFAFVALRPIYPGETIYFTDNGWSSAGFRGASATDGNGTEDLMKWTAVTTIAAGQIVRTDETGVSYSWTTSGAIPPGSVGNFAMPDLSATGDQIYAFQGPANNPMFNPSNHIFVFDDTNGFEEASSSTTGNVTPGLSTASASSPATAVTFNFPGAVGAAFKTNASAAGGKARWLGLINNTLQWNSGALVTLPSSSSLMTVSPLVWNTTSGTWNATNTNFSDPIGATTFMDGDRANFGNVASNATLSIPGTVRPSEINLSNAANRYDFNGAGAIAGDAVVTKSGAGIAAFNVGLTYTGTTTISGGALLINSTLAGAGNDVIVNGGAIGGTGSIQRNVKINAGGSIAPGDGGFKIGVLSISTAGTALTLASGGSLVWNVNALPSLGTAGTNWDKLTLDTLSVTADNTTPFTIKLVSVNGDGTASGNISGMLAGHVYSWLLGTAGTISGLINSHFSFDATDFHADQSGTWSIDQGGGNIFLTYSVPEPSGVSIALAAGALLSARRSGRKNRADRRTIISQQNRGR